MKAIRGMLLTGILRAGLVAGMLQASPTLAAPVPPTTPVAPNHATEPNVHLRQAESNLNGFPRLNIGEPGGQEPSFERCPLSGVSDQELNVDDFQDINSTSAQTSCAEVQFNRTGAGLILRQDPLDSASTGNNSVDRSGASGEVEFVLPIR